MRIHFIFLVICAQFTGGLALAEEKKGDESKNLSSYLTDVSAGAVSAGNLAGLSESAIVQVQSSQDLVVALKPFSSSSSKNGFGLAITPARTTLTPMSGKSYVSDDWMRVLGSLTISYAENSATLSSTSFRKSAFSIDGFYYINREDDPVFAANTAFAHCPAKDAALDKMMDPKISEATRQKLQAEAEAAVKACVDEKLKKAAWNASRISLSLGEGWIKADDNSTSKTSLGKSFTLGAIFRSGEQGAVYVSLRRTNGEVDLKTLKSAAMDYKDSGLAAIRYTYGSKEDNGDLKAMIEVSNAKSSVVTATNSAYKYAVGIDKKIAKGAWLEFRLGRNRILDGTSLQTSGLLNIKFAPTESLFSN